MCPVLGVMKQGLPEGRDPRNSQGHKRKALKSQKTSVPSVGSLDKLHQIPRAGPTTTSSLGHSSHPDHIPGLQAEAEL